jgi:hypothetical protein
MINTLAPPQISLNLAALLSDALGEEIVVDDYELVSDGIKINAETFAGDSLSGILTSDGEWQPSEVRTDGMGDAPNFRDSGQRACGNCVHFEAKGRNNAGWEGCGLYGFRTSRRSLCDSYKAMYTSLAPEPQVSPQMELLRLENENLKMRLTLSERDDGIHEDKACGKGFIKDEFECSTGNSSSSNYSQSKIGRLTKTIKGGVVTYTSKSDELSLSKEELSSLNSDVTKGKAGIYYTLREKPEFRLPKGADAKAFNDALRKSGKMVEISFDTYVGAGHSFLGIDKEKLRITGLANDTGTAFSLSNRTKLKLAMSAKGMYPDILQDLTPGTLLMNTPVGGSKGARSRIYTKMGFSAISAGQTWQFAVVGEDKKLQPLNIYKQATKKDDFLMDSDNDLADWYEALFDEEMPDGLLTERDDTVHPAVSLPKTDDDTPIKRTIFWKGFEIGLQYQPFDLRHEKLLPCGYGEIVGTNGQDGMALDCYVGSNLDSDRVFVIDQLNAQTGEFDEHKLFIGFDDDAATIKNLFVSLMGQERFGGIRETVPAKVWDLHEDSEHFDKRCGKGFIAENLECHKDPVSEDLTSEFSRNLETFTNTKGERRWSPTQTASTTYSTFNIINPPTGLTGAGVPAFTQLSVVQVATLDLNQSLALPPKGGNPAEDPFDEQLEWNKAILKKALPFGGIVTLADDMFEGAPERTKKMAAALGLKLPEFMFDSDEEKPDTVENVVKWARSEAPDQAEDFVKRINGFYIGKYSNGKITPVTKHDVESIDAIRKLRKSQIRELPGTNTSPNFLKASYENEDLFADKLAKIEDAYLGRKPTKIKSLEAYKAKANKWAEEQFGKVDAGANGFSLEQTLAHDVAHPIVHEMLKSSTDGINKRFGSTLQNDGRPSLVLEEAIVNVAEHLSRGDSIEASILNGLRLAKVLSRNKEVQSDAVRAQVRDRAFTHELAKMGHELYRHKNFSLYMKYIRETNRISGTVTQAGDDFTNSASGG